MLNKVILIGRVGKDPEIKDFSGRKLARIALATSEKYTSNGVNKEDTEWHNLEMWGKAAEVAEKWAKKGMLLYVDGKIKTQKYEAKDGEKKQSVSIVVGEFRIIDWGHKTEKTQSHDDFF